jgi:hypothetical protein
VKEQSHIEDMRAAVRGDIERAGRRRLRGESPPVSVLNAPTAEPASLEKQGLVGRVAARFRRT